MGDTLNDDLRWLYSLENMGIKLGLSNERALLKALGDPHERFGSVHVAGSNGKGSVSAMTASILRSAGHRTGLYTSPHLVRFTERITVDGQEMAEGRLRKKIAEVRELVDGGAFPRPLTFFEITTALAFLHFADENVEEAVVEVGMGGRLDATNVVHPRCSVITRIGVEHTAYLGDTAAKIAYEKASIIKEGVPVVSSPQSPEVLRVIRWMAQCRNAPSKIMGHDFSAERISSDMNGSKVHLSSLNREVRVGLLGGYQCENAAVAAECAMTLAKNIEITGESIVVGLSKARWPGRLEVVGRHPLTVLDVTHTPEGARTVASELAMFPGSPRVLVVGMLKDKDAKGAMAALGPHFDQVICTGANTPRALTPQQMAEACGRTLPQVRTVEGVDAALETALSVAGESGFVMVCGSLYTVGEAIQFLGGKNGP